MPFKFFQNHPIVAFILALLFTHEILYSAFAASGGRMGGSSFSSEEETSSYSFLSNSDDVYHYHNDKPGYCRGFESYDGNSQRVNAEPKRENDKNKSDKGSFSWFALFSLLSVGIFGGFFLLMVCTAASVVKIRADMSQNQKKQKLENKKKGKKNKTTIQIQES